MKDRTTNQNSELENPIIINAFKAFDKNLQCKGFQYEIGKSYSISNDKKIVRCGDHGFHACENPLDVLHYYNLIGSRFATVEMSGSIDKDAKFDSKIASRNIKIKAEVNFEYFIKASIIFIFGTWFKKTIDEIKSDKKTVNASSGYCAKNASSGYCATNASSGDESTNASSGDESTNASSGDRSTNASSGARSTNASSGYCATNASSGYESTNASSGDCATNASSGYCATNASSGDESKNASSGDNAKNASSGNNAKNASSGDGATNASSGDGAKNASSGNYATNASSGNNATNASSGNRSQIEMKGLNNVGSSVGMNSKIKGVNGNLICLVHYIDNNPVKWVTGIVGENGLLEDTWYKVGDSGEFEISN